MTQSYNTDQICDLAVIRAWSLEYQGNAHEILLKAIDGLHTLEVAKNYAKIIPIAQSSGTGKSKTVDKVATRDSLPNMFTGRSPEKLFWYVTWILDSWRKIITFSQHTLLPTE
jgi:hypothetical protein